MATTNNVPGFGKVKSNWLNEVRLDAARNAVVNNSRILEEKAYEEAKSNLTVEQLEAEGKLKLAQAQGYSTVKEAQAEDESLTLSKNDTEVEKTDGRRKKVEDK